MEALYFFLIVCNCIIYNLLKSIPHKHNWKTLKYKIITVNYVKSALSISPDYSSLWAVYEFQFPGKDTICQGEFEKTYLQPI